jgi:hypothetical protein
MRRKESLSRERVGKGSCLRKTILIQPIISMHPENPYEFRYHFFKYYAYLGLATVN